MFTTAAEELRARAEASIAVAAAYSTTSAPTTPARQFGTYEAPSAQRRDARAEVDVDLRALGRLGERGRR